MAILRAYAAPLPGFDRWAIGLAPPSQRELAGIAWWRTTTAASLRLDLYVPAAIPDEAGLLRTAAAQAIRESASRAADLPVLPVPGPSRALGVALMVWGWVLILSSGGHPFATLGGLWLAVGMPAMRGWFRRSQQGWRRTVQDALAATVASCEREASLPGVLEVRQVTHRGLAALAALAEEPPDLAEALRSQWRLTARPDLAELRPIYAAHYDALQAGRPLLPAEARLWPEARLGKREPAATQPEAGSVSLPAKATAVGPSPNLEAPHGPL